MKMTLKEIARNNNIDYGLVYSGAREAGVLLRRRKNVEYDEADVLAGVCMYISKRIEKNLMKVAEFTEDRERVMRSLAEKVS